MGRTFRLVDEDSHQEAIFNWCAYQLGRYPELELLHHVPNGGKRDAAMARALKRRGVKAGVPDLVLPVARGGYHGLYIELKDVKNKPTEAQKWWLGKLEEQGYYTTVCYGWQEAVTVLCGYLDGKLKRKDDLQDAVAKMAATAADAGLFMPAT